jgi:hypothetical protein
VSKLEKEQPVPALPAVLSLEMLSTLLGVSRTVVNALERAGVFTKSRPAACTR